MPRKKKIVVETPQQAIIPVADNKTLALAGEFQQFLPIEYTPKKVGIWTPVLLISIIVITVGLLSGLMGYFYGRWAGTSAVILPTAYATLVPAPTLTSTNTITLTPTVTPTMTPVPCYPCQSIINYFAILDKGNYGEAWRLFTSRYQNLTYQGDYNKYFDETWKVGPISIAELEREPDDGEFAVIYAKLYYSRTGLTAPYRYWLLYDARDKIWRIDNVEYVSLMK